MTNGSRFQSPQPPEGAGNPNTPPASAPVHPHPASAPVQPYPGSVPAQPAYQPGAPAPMQPQFDMAPSRFDKGTVLDGLVAGMIALGGALIVSLILGLIVGTSFNSAAADSGFDTVWDSSKFSLALPFLLLALSLGGAATFSMGGAVDIFGTQSGSFSVTLWSAPLIITAVFTALLWWWSNRTERARPSASAAAFWTKIAASALSVAIVTVILQLVFAMRVHYADEYSVIHASLSGIHVLTVVMPLIMTALIVIMARVAGHWNGLDTLRQPWVRTIVPAFRAAAWHFALSVGILSIVGLTFMASQPDYSFGAALLIMVNVGIYLASMGHLGGLSISAAGALGGIGDIVSGMGGGLGQQAVMSSTLSIFTNGIPGYLWLTLLVTVLALLVAGTSATVTMRPTWIPRADGRSTWADMWKIPLTFMVVWGLASLLLVPLRFFGSAQGELIDELGAAAGSMSIGPSPWTFLVFGLWGAVVEVLARTVCPKIATTLPGLAKFLGGRTVHPYWGYTLGMSQPWAALRHPDAAAEAGVPPAPQVSPVPGQAAAGAAAGLGAPGFDGVSWSAGAGSQGHLAPASGPAGYGSSRPAIAYGSPVASGTGPAVMAVPTAPPNPADGKRVKLFAIIGGGLVLLLIASIITVTQINSRVFGPKGVAESYLQKIADGDAEGALELADVDVPDENRQLLTNDVLKGAAALPSGIRTTNVTGYGDTAQVSLEYDLAGSKSTVTLDLYRAGRKALLFDDWRIRTPQLGSLNVDTGPLGEVNVNGVTVSAGENGDIGLPAFPAQYTVAPAEETAYYSAEEVTARTFFGGRSADVEGSDTELSVEPTQALTDELSKQVNSYLDDCASKDDPAGAGCPFGLDDSQEVRNVKWSITTYPSVELGSGSDYWGQSPAGGEGDGPGWNFTTKDTGEALVTGDYKGWDDEWDTFDYDATIWVSGYVQIIDGKVVVSYDD